MHLASTIQSLWNIAVSVMPNTMAMVSSAIKEKSPASRSIFVIQMPHAEMKIPSLDASVIRDLKEMAPTADQLTNVMIIQIVEITKDVNIIQRVHDTNVPVFRDTVKLIHSV